MWCYYYRAYLFFCKRLFPLHIIHLVLYYDLQVPHRFLQFLFSKMQSKKILAFFDMKPKRDNCDETYFAYATSRGISLAYKRIICIKRITTCTVSVTLTHITLKCADHVDTSYSDNRQCKYSIHHSSFIIFLPNANTRKNIDCII
jgi:hypothetical protein